MMKWKGSLPSILPRSSCLVCRTCLFPYQMRSKLTPLTANEENTFNINDLWVSAAVAGETAVFEDDDEEEMRASSQGEDEDEQEEDDETTPQPSPSRADSLAPSFPPNSGSARRAPKQRIVSGASMRLPQHQHRFSTNRRFSTASGHMPAIFANSGVSEPAALALPVEDNSNDDPFFGTPQSERRAPPLGGLSVITEGRANHERSPLISPSAEMVVEKPVSTWKSLPIMMIIQYGLLALHNTTHDQIFLSFLTT